MYVHNSRGNVFMIIFVILSHRLYVNSVKIFLFLIGFMSFSKIKL